MPLAARTQQHDNMQIIPIWCKNHAAAWKACLYAGIIHLAFKKEGSCAQTVWFIVLDHQGTWTSSFWELFKPPPQTLAQLHLSMDEHMDMLPPQHGLLGWKSDWIELQGLNESCSVSAFCCFSPAGCVFLTCLPLPHKQKSPSCPVLWRVPGDPEHVSLTRQMSQEAGLDWKVRFGHPQAFS